MPRAPESGMAGTACRRPSAACHDGRVSVAFNAASTAGAVSVVVIGYNDATHLPAAVASALAQGDAVREVIVVDDASTDDTPDVAAKLAAEESRVRVIRRATNSGGCGTPRNDGTDAAQAPWLMFLDSDDVLPPGAVDALLTAALRDNADVAAGLCVRVELPEGRRRPWQPELYTTPGVHDGITDRPRTLWDTLSVNKLYRRDLLAGKHIRFPDGSAHYEDFVFTARLYAASPRITIITDTVYLWQVRHHAAALSISLRRDRITNWQDRLDAHRQVMDTLRGAGDRRLLVASQVKFLDHDLAMYLRDLPTRDPHYRQEWWRLSREHLAAFEPEVYDDPTTLDELISSPAATWRAAVLRGRDEALDAGLGRLSELSADPPRLAPPYALDGREPSWDEHTPAIPLAGLSRLDAAKLPLCVSADAVAARRLVLRLRLHELYGRLAAANPRKTWQATVELRHRVTATVHSQHVEFVPGDGGDWRASASFDTAALSRPAAADPAAVHAWDVWVRLVFPAEETTGTPERVAELKARAGGGLGRHVRLGAGARVLLVQPYATVDRSLAVRVADGLAGGRRVLAARLARRR
jgi:glycosyltransferase involved in cell wall biosynthesis